MQLIKQIAAVELVARSILFTEEQLTMSAHGLVWREVFSLNMAASVSSCDITWENW